MNHKRLHYSFAILLVFFICSPVLNAQVSPTPAAEDDSAATWKFGSEVDVLPFARNGYYASGFVARDGWRLRGVAARAEAPGFLVSDGFEKKRTDAYAVLVDRFLGARKNQLEGFWVGAGAELWRSRIRQENTSEFTRYNNSVLTAGGGYVWKFSKHAYLNPWGALHAVVGGDRKINVSGRTYEQPELTPEVSLKIGIVF